MYKGSPVPARLCCPWSPRLSSLGVHSPRGSRVHRQFPGHQPSESGGEEPGEVRGLGVSMNLLLHHPGDSGALLFELHLRSTSLGFS